MKSAEVHNLKDDELVTKLIDAKEEAFNLRFRHATGELENTARLGQTKRDVARLVTVARERGIDVEKETRKDERREHRENRDDRGAAGRGDSGRVPPGLPGARAPSPPSRIRSTTFPGRSVVASSVRASRTKPARSRRSRSAPRPAPPTASRRPTNGAKNAPR